MVHRDAVLVGGAEEGAHRVAAGVVVGVQPPNTVVIGVVVVGAVVPQVPACRVSGGSSGDAADRNSKSKYGCESLSLVVGLRRWSWLRERSCSSTVPSVEWSNTPASYQRPAFSALVIRTDDRDGSINFAHRLRWHGSGS